MLCTRRHCDFIRTFNRSYITAHELRVRTPVGVLRQSARTSARTHRIAGRRPIVRNIRARHTRRHVRPTVADVDTCWRGHGGECLRCVCSITSRFMRACVRRHRDDASHRCCALRHWRSDWFASIIIFPSVARTRRTRA